MMPFTTYQTRVWEWLRAAFEKTSPWILTSRVERNHRFLEEACEVVQANGMTKIQAERVLGYAFSRPVGEIKQEVGGALNTLAALCQERGIDMIDCGETELLRCWRDLGKIRDKQKTKPKHAESGGAAVAKDPPKKEVQVVRRNGVILAIFDSKIDVRSAVELIWRDAEIVPAVMETWPVHFEVKG